MTRNKHRARRPPRRLAPRTPVPAAGGARRRGGWPPDGTPVRLSAPPVQQFAPSLPCITLLTRRAAPPRARARNPQAARAARPKTRPCPGAESDEFGAKTFFPWAVPPPLAPCPSVPQHRRRRRPHGAPPHDLHTARRRGAAGPHKPGGARPQSVSQGWSPPTPDPHAPPPAAAQPPARRSSSATGLSCALSIRFALAVLGISFDGMYTRASGLQSAGPSHAALRFPPPPPFRGHAAPLVSTHPARAKGPALM
ncbi:MAG: hypothetical protein J3K34DRAFT_411689 [Monoraphidium minutum]|nr:MAG: hypothetical protein J3K34DRAFT_411689 [Monoraphidium minutum]